MNYSKKMRVELMLSCLSLHCLAPLDVGAQPGSPDTNFNATITGQVGSYGFVHSLAVGCDGKVLVGGSFTAVNATPRSCIARLNTDGSLDTDFDPGTGANNEVLSVMFQSDGKALIGGLFTSAWSTSVPLFVLGTALWAHCASQPPKPATPPERAGSPPPPQRASFGKAELLVAVTGELHGIAFDQRQNLLVGRGGKEILKVDPRGKVSPFVLLENQKWEYACRAGGGGEWCFGDDPSPLNEHGWYLDNSGHRTRPVGLKRPNAWELHDMHGNVGEWCVDWYDAYEAATAKNPSGPFCGTRHVVRGGTFCDDAAGVRSAKRGSLAADPEAGWSWCGGVGFRVCRVSDAAIIRNLEFGRGGRPLYLQVLRLKELPENLMRVGAFIQAPWWLWPARRIYSSSAAVPTLGVVPLNNPRLLQQ